jgi:ketosteroid isomerase-like protein
MSQENVESAYRAADAFNRRDLNAFLAFIDPEVEFRPLDVEIEGGGPYRGYDGFRRWFEDELRVFPDISGEIEEIRDLGDVTLALVRIRGRGTGSELLAEGMSWQVTRWRDGRAIWFRDFRTEAEALEAVGQRE